MNYNMVAFLVLVSLQLDLASPGGTYLINGVCYVKPRLEVLFMWDQSVSWTWSQLWTKWRQKLAPKLAENFADTKFAIATFTDYPKSDVQSRGHNNDPEGCYIFHQALTTDTKRTVEKIEQIEAHSDSTGTASWMSAVLFATEDSKIGWSSKKFDEDGRYIQKIILVSVSRNITVITHPRNRTKPLVDGNDNCEKTLPPTHRQLGQVLNKGSYFLAFLESAATHQLHISTVILHHLNKIGAQSTLFTKPNTLEFTPVNNRIINDFKNRFNNQECYFPDPPAYNILGY